MVHRTKVTPALRVGIVMGDPAGIGPEIVAKALRKPDEWPGVSPVVVGDAGLVERCSEGLGINVEVNVIEAVEPDQLRPNAINVLHVADAGTAAIRPGEVSARAGKASMLYAERGAQLALSGAVDALLTCPVTKASVLKAGYDFPGQAEFYATYAEVSEFVTVLISGAVKVALLTTHYPLIEACRRVKKEAILDKLRLIRHYQSHLGLETVRIGVAALNPHGGEGGLIGREEVDEISPAIAQARSEGIDADGPYPVNAILSPPRKFFGVILAMYHDQAVGCMDMMSTTTLTLGLPFIRTSVGHGTGLDIAGKGMASEAPLAAALEATINLARKKREQEGGEVP